MPSSYAAFEQRLPPTAPSHSVACHLTSPTSSSTSYPSSRGVLLSHLVTARDDTIRVWEVRSPADAGASPQLHHIHTKTLFGTTTGLQATKTIESDSDGKDRLIVSFKDAKIALLEWDQVSQSLATISIHTYERASQLVSDGRLAALMAAPRLTDRSHASPTAFHSTSDPFSHSTHRTAALLSRYPKTHSLSFPSPRHPILISSMTQMTCTTFTEPETGAAALQTTPDR